MAGFFILTSQSNPKIAFKRQGRVGPKGTIIESQNITNFSARMMSRQTPLDTLTTSSSLHLKPCGWTGHFTYDRCDDVLDSLFADIEKQFRDQASVPVFVIAQTITNPDGSISEYRFEGVTLEFDNAGHYTGDSIVKQSVMFVAWRRLKVQ